MMKSMIAYDGWKRTGKDRYELPDKVVVAGFSEAKEFYEYREAAIAQKYNLNEVSERILNADRASWIKKGKDKSICFQLDPFHRNKSVREKIHDGKAVRDIMELPVHPEGLEYRNMGMMENHVWSVIARRMKHNHTSWSRRGGNHLAQILAKKCSGKLYEVTERLKRQDFRRRSRDSTCHRDCSQCSAG